MKKKKKKVKTKWTIVAYWNSKTKEYLISKRFLKYFLDTVSKSLEKQFKKVKIEKRI